MICADDFGQRPGVDAAVTSLAAAGRVTAVSCLSFAPWFERDLPALLSTGASVGLHLDLTEGLDGAPATGLGALILRSYLGRLDRRAVTARLEAQLDAFERAAGRAPAFVDGHRHVHQLPGIRPAVVDVLARRYAGAPPLVRVTVPRRWRGAKAALIAGLGGRGLERRLARRGLPRNADFAGVYGFDTRRPYRERARGWLRSLDEGGLLMCHPGEPDGEADPIAPARAAELRYLASPAFEEDCSEAAVTPVRVLAERGAAGLPL